MMLGILLFIPDDDGPYSITGRLMSAVPAGSYLAVSHGASDINPDEAAESASRYNERSAAPMRLRTKTEFTGFFEGLEILAPGVMPVDLWQPGRAGTGAGLSCYAALGRKPG
jgi:S-adenosyl methyltransferase